jgi:predicted nuclease with TOPRIM domain
MRSESGRPAAPPSAACEEVLKRLEEQREKIRRLKKKVRRLKERNKRLRKRSSLDRLMEELFPRKREEGSLERVVQGTQRCLEIVQAIKESLRTPQV